MTQDQRIQAAAQRCADLANEKGNHDREAFIPEYFVGGPDPYQVALDQTLALDSFARMVLEYSGYETLHEEART